MSYRYIKNGQETDLVIDGFEQGIADSPFQGIGNIRNLNVRYYAGVAYVNYKRQACTFTTQPSVTGSLSMNATTATLTTNWTFPTGVFPVTFSNGDVRNVTFTNASLTITWTPGLSASATTLLTVNATSGYMFIPKYGVQSPAGFIYMSDSAGNIFKQNSVNGSNFVSINTTGLLTAGSTGLQWWNNYLIAWGTTTISICGNGTSDAGIVSNQWDTAATAPTTSAGVWPVKNATITLTGNITAGDSTATISAYTDAQGTSRSVWNGPTGNYIMNIGTSGGQTVLATLTHNVAAFSFAPPSIANSNATVLITVVGASTAGTSATQHQSIVSVNNGNIYFTNGSNVGDFIQTSGTIFNKTDFTTFSFGASAVPLPTSDTATWLTELRTNLLIAGSFNIYSFDLTSATNTKIVGFVPMNEKITKIINILNNIYIFAGNKGNIYLSNGTSVSPFKKIPDYIAGVIDPAWYIGGIMQHRQRLFFQALAVNSQTGANIFSGIFSLSLVSGNGITLETAGSLVMDSQNSFGLNNASSTLDGLLIDNNQITSLNYDNYYSAWNATTGGIDFNDTTLWSSNEPLIETDIIPTGTFLQNKTYQNMEFKLDQPMQSGDSITVYARQSLSDTYVLVGTTSTAVLSYDYTPLGFQQGQWIQFKVTMSCNPTATASSFMRLREIRIR